MTDRPTDTYLLKGRRELGVLSGATAPLVIDPVNDFLSEGADKLYRSHEPTGPSC